MKKISSVRLPSLVAVLLGISLFTSQTISHATIIEHTSFARICQEADAIIEGTVSSVTTGESGDSIVTDVVLTEIEMIKGEVPDPFTLTFVGGTVGSRSIVIPGTPSFEVGERKIIFLRRLGSDVGIFGMWEGVFTIKEVADHTVIERADGRFVSDVDYANGELRLYIPRDSFSKPISFMGQDGFRTLIRFFSGPRGRGGKEQFSE